MYRINFLAYRAAFAGVPFGVLQPLLEKVRGSSVGSSLSKQWGVSLVAAARHARRRSSGAARRGHLASAAEAWLEAARAYHVASFRLHLSDCPAAQMATVRRLRRLAKACYLRALDAGAEQSHALWPRRFDAAGIDGYLHLPGGRPRAVVVLLNGLDSLCEVEMHAFARPAVQRGLAALAVDLPGDFAGRLNHTLPERWRLEQWTGPIADALDCDPVTTGLPIGAFGVSFGGHLAARTLAGDRPFRAAVAVSPGAYINTEQLKQERIVTMARLALDPEGQLNLHEFGRAIDLRLLPKTNRPLRLEAMSRDALFGSEHVNAVCSFAPGTEIFTHDAEHVGTSVIHCWLPQAFDWLAEKLCMDHTTPLSITNGRGDSTLVTG